MPPRVDTLAFGVFRAHQEALTRSTEAPASAFTPAFDEALGRSPRRDRPANNLLMAGPIDQPEPLAGLIVIDKPHRLSSTSIVRVVKRRARGAKTGHAGTLDPLASGVLICCVGRATRWVERLMGMTKTYECGIDLSARSTTDDLEGDLTRLEGLVAPVRGEIERIIAARFTGSILQTPPIHSAMRLGGKRAYELARRGREVALQPRSVRIDSIEILEYQWPLLALRVVCGRGTYIRSLARDVGAALNVGGCLTALRRTAVGPFDLSRAWALDDVPDPIEQRHLVVLDDPA